MSCRIVLPAFAVLVLCSVVGIADDAKKPQKSDVERVEAALEKWAAAKKSSGGNYEYTVRFQSFVGFGSKSTIVVRENKVVERRYETFNLNDANAGQEGWVEKGEEVGKHRQGVPARTLDEVYENAKKIASEKLPPHLRRYVRTDSHGLLTSCFTVDTRIADDAPTRGVRLHSITLAKPGK